MVSCRFPGSLVEGEFGDFKRGEVMENSDISLLALSVVHFMLIFRHSHECVLWGVHGALNLHFHDKS